MNLLQRYILNQILGTSLAAVGLLVFVLVTFNASKDFGSELFLGLVSFPMLAQFLMLLIPYAIAFAMPLGLLTAILLVLGRLSAERELIALRSAGLSIYRILSPVMLIVFAGIMISLFVNFYYSPQARTAYKDMTRNILQDDPLKIIKERTFIKEFPGYILYVGEKDQGELRDLWVWMLNDKEQVTLFIKAEKGTLTFDEAAGDIVLTPMNAIGEMRRQKDPERFDSESVYTSTFGGGAFRFSLDEIFDQGGYSRKLSLYTLTELLQLRSDTIQNADMDQDERFAEQIRIQMQIQKNFALAFSILSLAIVAIPLGIKASRTETYANFGIALGLGIGYYFMMELVSWLQVYPQMRPDLLIWLPNIAFQGFGFWGLKKINEH